MKKVTLVQMIADFDTYQKMIQDGELPLVLELTKDEAEVFMESLGNSGLYFGLYGDEDQEKKNFLLSAHCLREAIENKEIYISKFIDINGNTKYVDYIRASHSVDFGDMIVFRKRKRWFGKSQVKYSLQKNKVKLEMVRFGIGNVSSYVPTLIPTKEHSEREELYTLCTNLLDCQQNDNKASKVRKL